MPDILWKEIIEDLFEDFLQFFMPDLYEKVDFSKGYEFLDQELSKIVDKTLFGKKISDRLVKVFLKDGAENWILIHIEVQGYYEIQFSERMFKYFYRIYDKYSKKIVALTIFTDARKGYEPSSYNYTFHGTELSYKYNTYKLLAHRDEEFINDDNPFALVMLAGLYTIKSKKSDDLRYRFKTKLLRLLIKKKYSSDKIRRIFSFLDGILFLPTTLEQQFKDDVTQIAGGDETMPIVKEMTNIYQAGKHEGEVKEKREVAKKLLRMGMDIVQIIDITELSREEIQEIAKEIQNE